MYKFSTPLSLLATALLLVACSSQPRVPEEQSAAKVEDHKPAPSFSSVATRA